MKNVLLISSSPRRGGNSDLLCDAFAKGAEEAGNKTTKIRLAEKRIGYWNDSATEDDDAREILDQMMADDVIVLASPVYFYSISGQLKVLFDRAISIYGQMKDKAFYFLVTMADNDRKRLGAPVLAMQGFLDCFEGSKLMGQVLADSVNGIGDVLKTRFHEEARELGRSV